MLALGGAAVAAAGGGALALTWGNASRRSRRHERKPASATTERVPKRPLPIPKLIDVDADRSVELVMRAGQTEILPGVRTNTIGFNGPYLGPTLRMCEGQDVALSWVNRLREAVAVHGHGLHVPGELAGGPQRSIEPGATWSPVLPIRQQAGKSWYHPHTHGQSGAQTYQGLAGMLLIEDDNSRELPLPKTYGVDDLPLIV